MARGYEMDLRKDLEFVVQKEVGREQKASRKRPGLCFV